MSDTAPAALSEDQTRVWIVPNLFSSTRGSLRGPAPDYLTEDQMDYAISIQGGGMENREKQRALQREVERAYNSQHQLDTAGEENKNKKRKSAEPEAEPAAEPAAALSADQKLTLRLLDAYMAGDHAQAIAAEVAKKRKLEAEPAAAAAAATAPLKDKCTRPLDRAVRYDQQGLHCTTWSDCLR
jgi:hypothetical protein